MKYKTLILFAGMLLTSLILDAQQKTDYNLRYVTLDSLIRLLESNHPQRFFYAPKQTDTLLISLQTKGRNPLDALREELRKAGFALSTGPDNQVYILKGEGVSKNLPLNFYAEGAIDDSVTSNAFADLQQQHNMQDENRLYTLGDPLQSENNGIVRLTGYVREKTTGEPVPGINVLSEDKKYYAMSDTYGFYSLQIPRGYNTLKVQGYGYKDAHRYIRIFSESTLDLVVEEEVFALQGIVISAEKMENVRNVQLGVEKVRADRIRSIPMAFGEADVIKVVLTLPGVKSVGEAAGGFNVRGGATDQNLILFNEGTIYNSSHLFGLFSLFNNDVVNSIELYKSSIPAKYGGRISSVLEVTSREGNKNKISGSAGIGLLTTKLNLEGPIVKNKTSFILSGRTTYSDWLMNLIPENSGYNDGSANFYDINAGVSHKFNDKNFLYLNGYYSQDRFAFSRDTSYKYRNLDLSLKYRSVFNDNSQMVLSAAYDHYNYHTQDVSNAYSAYDMAFAIEQMAFKADFISRLNDHHKLNYGLNAVGYALNPGTYTPFDNNSLVKAETLEQEQAVDFALYFGDTWDISQNLSFDLGVRYNFYSALGPKKYYTYQEGVPRTEFTISDTLSLAKGKFMKPYHGPEFRASMRYAFNPTFSVKAGFNSMRQNIHMLSNSTVISPTDIWKLSDSNIRPQTGWQAAMGVYKNLNNNTIELSLEGYYKQMSHYLDYASSAQLLMNDHIETDVIETSGKAYGVEFMVKRSLGRLNGWFSYTYSRTLLQQNDPTISTPINGGEWYPAAYDKPHDVKLVGNFKFTHRFSLSANLDYSTGRPITMPVGTYYYSDGWRLYYTDRNASRIPDYFRLDLAFNIEPSHKLTLLTHSSLTIGIYNVTARKNPYSVFFKTENGKVNAYMLSIFGSPIPYITYNIKF